MLSRRIQALAPSPTLALDARVKLIQAQGIKVVNLGLGEPDFPSSNTAKQGAIDALAQNFTHYTPAAGIPQLRQAIAHKLASENNLNYSPDEIVVSVGTKQLLYNAFQVLCNPGDEVLVATPTWSTYLEQIKLAEAVPVLIPLTAPFQLTAAEVADHITPQTKVLVLNSPANPTGAMISPTELVKIAKLAVEKKLLVVSDEIYEKIIYTQAHVSIASLNPEIKARTLTVNGFSKAYAMTGWRIGYAAGPADIIKGLVALQGQVNSGTSSISQYAALAALEGDQTSVSEMCAEFAARREMVLKKLAKISQLIVQEPEGAFYLFVSLAKILNQPQPNGRTYSTSAAWCQALLEETRVAVVPGEAFEMPGFFRLSFATSRTELTTGLKNISTFVNGAKKSNKLTDRKSK